MPMIATTISSSMSVKPLALRIFCTLTPSRKFSAVAGPVSAGALLCAGLESNRDAKLIHR
jgi:hypothetical protein